MMATGSGTKVEHTTEIEPKFPTDRLMEGLGGKRRWFKRGGRKALKRLQSILEEDHDRGKRASVAGV